MFTYQYPEKARISFGLDALSALPEIVDSFGVSRILLLTTRSLVDSAIAKTVREGLGERCVAVIGDSSQHVPEGSVDDLLRRAGDLAPDMIVCLGGGSVTDSAKALAVGLAEGYTRAEQIHRHRIRFTYPDQVEVEPFTAMPRPLLAIPTTLSAAEYDGIFGMTSGDGVKELYTHDDVMPKAVILDPAATVETPERLWLGTGIRTLDHAVESYLSRSPTPFTDPLALQAVELISENLPRTKSRPEDMEARLNCLIAGWLSMVGVANVTLGLSHGIGHQVGAYSGVPHGETSCVMMPVVAQRIHRVVPDRSVSVVTALGGKTGDRKTEEAAALLPSLLRDFISGLGLPTRLSEVGVREGDLPVIARAAMADMVVAFSPVTVTEDEVLELLREAW